MIGGYGIQMRIIEDSVIINFHITLTVSFNKVFIRKFGACFTIFQVLAKIIILKHTD